MPLRCVRRAPSPRRPRAPARSVRAARRPAPPVMSEPTDNAAEAPKKKGLPPAVLPIAALVLGLAGGVAAGIFAVGPLLAEGIAPAVAASAAHKPAKGHAEEGDEEHADGEEAAEGEEEEGGEEKKAEGGEHGEGAASAVYTMDNLVLNPAESGGTRFLLFTIAFEMKDQAQLDALKARDAEMRDVVIAALGSRTVDQLADMTLRDSLKVQLATTVSKELKKKKAVKRVYFPQFVIQ